MSVNVNVTVCVKLVAGLIVLTMLNAPCARSQNSAPVSQSPASTAQNPASPSAAQSPGAAASPATPAAGQKGEPLPEYPLPANGAPDAMPRRYIEMWNTGNFKLMDGMFTARPYLHYPAFSNLAMTSPLIVHRISLWRDCVPDLNFQILDTIVQGDKIVVLRLRYTGIYEKQCYNDIPAPSSGAPPVKIHVYEVLIFWLDHGKISDIWEQNDELSARLQMGAKWCDTTEPAAAAPSPPAPPAASPNSAPPSAPPSKP